MTLDLWKDASEMAGSKAIVATVMAVISGAAWAEMSQTFTDPRDGESYGVVDVAGMRWMTENLRYAADGSACYDNDEKNCERYGRLYAWEVALRACPAGWHLSTEYEWQKLELALGVPFDELHGNRERGEPAGEQIKAGGGHALTFPLAGYSDPELNFRNLDVATAIWTANESDFNHAWHRDLHVERTGIYRSRVYKPWLLSVRCVANRFE
jgi:uncharacterized protein (TIGR02145 family)